MFISKLTKLTGNDRKWRLIRSAAIYFAYMCFGMGLGTVGPTMLDLRILTRTRLEMATYTITGRAAGNALGSIISGLILNSKLDKQLFLSCCMFVAAVTEIAVPQTTTIHYMIGIFFINGVAFGGAEATVTTYCAFLWGPECEPFMQALQFSFGVGASIAPLVARNFLLPNEEEDDPEKFKFSPRDVKVHYCYEIVGVLCLIASIGTFILYKFVEPSPEHPERQRKPAARGTVAVEEAPPIEIPVLEFEKQTDDPPSFASVVADDLSKVSRPPLVVRQRSIPGKTTCDIVPFPATITTHKTHLDVNDNAAIVITTSSVVNGITASPRICEILKSVIIILLTAFMFFYCGIEITFGSYLTTYAVQSPLKMNKQQGALISALFWITFTFSRLLTIFYIKIIGSSNNLVLCMSFVLLSNIFLVPFANTEWCLWAGTVLIGIGTSSMWGSVFGFMELNFNVNSLMIGSLVTSACLGECVIPIVMSYTIGIDTRIFLWVTLGCSLVLAALLLVVIPLGHLFSRKRSQVTSP